MKKIGFIDYHIDEWHANNYPAWIRESSRKDSFELSYAWEENPGEGGRSLEKWCEDFSVTPARTVGEIVEKCDAFCILAPSNPEVHERLAEIPLKSGKPVYIDKPFAPDAATARRLFEKAESYGTPLMSSSALRYSTELQNAAIETFKEGRPEFVRTGGAGSSFWEYAIHQVEMAVALLGTGASRVMQCGNKTAYHMLIEYPGERRACITLMPGLPYQFCANRGSQTVRADSLSRDFFPNLTENILNFFDTGISPVPAPETIEIVSIVESGLKALDSPGEWIDVG